MCRSGVDDCVFEGESVGRPERKSRTSRGLRVGYSRQGLSKVEGVSVLV